MTMRRGHTSTVSIYSRERVGRSMIHKQVTEEDGAAFAKTCRQ